MSQSSIIQGITIRAVMGSMEDDQQRSPIVRGELLAEAHALSLTVAALRRARGKPNPEDFSADSPEWHEVAEGFARDVQRALECNTIELDDKVDVIRSHIDDDYLGIGAAGLNHER